MNGKLNFLEFLLTSKNKVKMFCVIGIYLHSVSIQDICGLNLKSSCSCYALMGKGERSLFEIVFTFSSDNDSDSEDQNDDEYLNEKSRPKNGLLSAKYKDSFTEEGMQYCRIL